MSLFLLESVFGLFCLMVRTLGFHPKNRSSILLQATNPGFASRLPSAENLRGSST